MDLEEEMIAEYREYWLAQRYASEGIDRRAGQVRDFFRFAQSRGVMRVAEITPEVVEAYERDLGERRTRAGAVLRPYTQRTVMEHLRAFLRHLVRVGRLLVDPTRDLILPPAPSRLPEVLSRREIRRLLDAPDLGTVLGVRDRALLACIYETGMRVTEVARLALVDVDFDARTITIRRGKGDKDRVVGMGNVLRKLLLGYLAQAREALLEFRALGRRMIDPGAFFLSMRGRALSRYEIQERIACHGRKARIKKAVGPHVLRHTCATHLVEAGADVRVVQELLGHRSLATTERYTRMSLVHLRRIHGRSHPREKQARRE